MLSVLQQVRDMPWLAKNEMRRWLAWPWIRMAFLWHGVPWGQGWRIFGSPIIQRHRGSTIALGDGLTLRSWKRSNPLAPTQPVVLATRSASSSVHIGDNCGLTGSVIVAEDHISVGDRVLIGANVTITDTDFHPLDPQERQEDINAGRSAPIAIGDDVFIGMNSLILKGVAIGNGSVVGAGSVITQDVPAHTIVAGNPASVIRVLKNS